jgi:hypothetical protein
MRILEEGEDFLARTGEFALWQRDLATVNCAESCHYRFYPVPVLESPKETRRCIHEILHDGSRSGRHFKVTKGMAGNWLSTKVLRYPHSFVQRIHFLP